MPSYEVKAITDKIVEDAKPEATAYFITEAQTQGFGIRIGAGAKTWFVRRKLYGTTRRIKIGTFPTTLVAKARKDAKIAYVQMEQQIHPNEAKKQRVEQAKEQAELERWTLAVLHGEYKAEPRERPLSANTLKGYEQAATKLQALSIWKRPIVKIQATDLRACFDDIVKSANPKKAKNGGKTTAAGVMRYVRVLLNFGFNERLSGKFENPFDKIPERQKWQQPNAKDRTIIESENSLADWWKAVESLRTNEDGRAKDGRAIADYLQLSLLFGTRRTELLTLTWDCVDLEDKTVIFKNTKNKKQHQIPLGPKAFEILTNASEYRRALPENERSDYVFPASRTGYVSGTKTHIKEPKSSISKVIDGSGVKFSPHDLRRTFGSLLGEIGASFYQMKAALNHSAGSDVSQKHYIRMRLKAMRDIFERLEKTILEEAKA